jgi:undecaprenyl-diphosphatase
MGWLIILGTLPIVGLGYLGQDVIRNDFRSLWLIASSLIVFGLILGIADRFGKTERQLHQLTPLHGVLYGFAQSLALIPGVSRSGATIAMGRVMGYTREAALRYSFLLALPAVFGSGLYELKGAIGETTTNQVFSLPETLIIYRVALGTALLALLATGVIS